MPVQEEQLNIPEGDSSLTSMLLRIFGITKEQLAALGQVNVSQLKGILWSTLKEKSFGISTALLAFVPFIGEYFLAGKALYKEGEDVKEAIIEKIKSQIPEVKIPEVKIPEAEIEMQDFSIPKSIPTELTKGGARARNTNAILRRIEKSKKAFHNTNKSNTTFGKSNTTFGKSNTTFGKSNTTFGKSKKPRRTRRRLAK
jgi:hypothetical protein